MPAGPMRPTPPSSSGAGHRICWPHRRPTNRCSATSRSPPWPGFRRSLGKSSSPSTPSPSHPTSRWWPRRPERSPSPSGGGRSWPAASPTPAARMRPISRSLWRRRAISGSATSSRWMPSPPARSPSRWHSPSISSESTRRRPSSHRRPGRAPMIFGQRRRSTPGTTPGSRSSRWPRCGSGMVRRTSPPCCTRSTSWHTAGRR